MGIKLSLLAGSVLAVAVGCHSETTQQQTAVDTSSVAPANLLQGVWQLDYYPDSLLLNKDIYAYSNWTTPYAANLRFAGDSCEFIGWHESIWQKIRSVEPGLYSAGDADQGYEIKFLSPSVLWFREYSLDKPAPGDSTEQWYPYHRVATVLTQAALKKRVAQELFAGRYHVLQTDRRADSVVVLGTDFSVAGLRGVARYNVVTDMDWDFLLPNAFSWQDRKGEAVAQYSFGFAGDTLVLNNFEQRPEDDSVPSGILVTTPAVKLLKASAGKKR
jgi:hypothetical protein